MKKVLLAICILLVLVSAGFAQTANWTTHNSNDYRWVCAASGSACFMDGVVATWTLARNITVTKVEYQSSSGIYQTSNTDPNLTGPCPVLPTITLSDGVNTYNLAVVDTGLYSSTKTVKWVFKAGRKLSVLSSFYPYVRSGVNGPCTTPPGNVVVSYTSP